MKKKIFYALLGSLLLNSNLSISYAQQTYENSVEVGSLPAIFPAPISTELRGLPISWGENVRLVTQSSVSEFTEQTLITELKGLGVQQIAQSATLPEALSSQEVTVILSIGKSPEFQSLLDKLNLDVESHKEGYVLYSGRLADARIVLLNGSDADGLFHATQTFRQLAQLEQFPSVFVRDYPTQSIRGTIEGFYGKPWTMEEREKHLAFLGSVKANTYVYTPKDDPYARDRWRDPYPADTLAQLGELAQVAANYHINFVYAISPGPSICFSCETDFAKLKDKVDALRSVGVRSFYVALDDIEYQKWNCEQDSVSYGPSGAKAAAIAQAEVLNKLQNYIHSVDPDAPNLIMVPTEYYNAVESPYKAALREKMDPDIVIQWTGTDVVPPSISLRDAKEATKAFGQPTLLWDNYPVNDFAQTTGRLLLAPYDKREAGLSSELKGILSNPMNQEVASRVAVTGVAAFAWNDMGYDADRTWHFAARELAGNDSKTTEALLVFFDTQHLAPIFGSHPWQEQAPGLKAILDETRDRLAFGSLEEKKQAVVHLLDHAKRFAAAPAIIRAGVIDQGFIKESEPWLAAMELWGQALQSSAEGLQAVLQSNGRSEEYFHRADQLAKQASAIQSIPGATRFEGPVKIADGVLDKFVEQAATLLYSPDSTKN